MRTMQFLAAAFVVAMAADNSQAAVQISSKPTSNMTCSGGVCSPTAKKAVLNVTDLTNMLASGDTTVTSGSQAQDIEIDAALSWTSTNRLTLDSYRSIAFNKPVIVAGTGALTITTKDGGSDGDFQFFDKGHIEFWDLSSSLIIDGHTYILAKTIRQIQSAVKGGAGFVALAKGFDASQTLYSHAPLPKLTGTFEGFGNTISHLTIHDSTISDRVAFFGEITKAATARDITLTSVEVSGDALVDQTTAGLAGYNQGKILNCRVTGNISSASDPGNVAGLVANNDGSITRCSTNVVVSSTAHSAAVGGLIGMNYDPGVVDQSYSAGAVSSSATGSGGPADIGGLIGFSYGGKISNSYSESAVTGTEDSYIGGLFGGIDYGGASPITIETSYSTGLITSSSPSLGGLIGWQFESADLADNYWDLDTSGVSDPSQGCGTIANDPGITGLTTAQFQSGLPAGFDKKIWREKTGINNGYPYLINNPPPQ